MLSDPETIFSDIFQTNAWRSPETVSGPGSELAATENIRRELPRIVRQYGIRKFLDLPCGDFNWMRHVELGVESYTGGDIVQRLVLENVKRHGGPGRTFYHLNLISSVLPEADLMLCRDCLVHLTFEQIADALDNLRRSRISYLLVTTFPLWPKNGRIETGGWTPLNLQLAPFHFPEPLELVNEGCRAKGYEDKSLGLWRIQDIPPTLRQEAQ